MSTSPGNSFPRLFLMFGVIPLLFIAGVQLFVLTDQTATFFAWTIVPPVTAAFMGAGYWAALCAAYMGLLHTEWSSLGASIPASFTATTMLGIATFLHLEKFHLESPLLITRFVTWVWIIVYVVTPPLLLAALIAQFRRGRTASASNTPAGWLRLAFLVQAVLCLCAGALLFLAPARVIPVWPWALTPLTARAIGAWLATFGVACATIFVDNNLRNSTGAVSSLLAFCVLELVVVARYFQVINWARPLAWVYLLFLFGSAVVSMMALRAGHLKAAAG